MSDCVPKNFSQRPRASVVRFTEDTSRVLEDASTPGDIGVPDNPAYRRSSRDRPATPGDALLTGGYFPSLKSYETTSVYPPPIDTDSPSQSPRHISSEQAARPCQPSLDPLHAGLQPKYDQPPRHDFQHSNPLAVEYLDTSKANYQSSYLSHSGDHQLPSGGRPALPRLEATVTQTFSPRKASLDVNPPVYPEKSHYNQHYPAQNLTHSANPSCPTNKFKGFEPIREDANFGACDLELGSNLHPRLDPSSAFSIAGVASRGDPQHRTTQPAKPSLRRATTEDIVEKEPNRKAADLVGSHINRRSGKPNFKAGNLETAQEDEFSDEDCDGTTVVNNSSKGGVLSHLLELYGNHRPGRVQRGDSTYSATTLAAESVAPSRQSSIDSRMSRRKVPFVAPWNQDEKINSSQPDYKSSKRGHKARDSDNEGSDTYSIRSAGSALTFREVVGAVSDKFSTRKTKVKERRATITRHVADILKRQNFILKLAKALMKTGAPSHRLESQLSATARVLEIDAQFIHLPSIVIAAFGDSDTRTSETHFVKANGGIDLGQLHRVHNIYRSVVHDHMGVGEGSAALHKILNEAPLYKAWQRMIIAFLCAGTISILGFAGSFVDAWVSGAFGAFLAFMQLKASTNQMYSSIFEISIATLVSFISRGLSTTGYFCYEALSSSGVVLILPGYVILCGSLELASKHMIAGSVKMVYAVIYSLFLGFGISIGSDFYYLLDPNARIQQSAPPTYEVMGSFSGFNGTIPGLNGTFTFVNSTVPHGDNLDQGHIKCFREPHWQWWRQSAGPLWFILLVPMFSFFLSLWNLQPIWTKQMPVMVIIACIGWVCNYFANKFIFNRSDVVSFLGAFVIGLLGNMYSRIFKGTAFTSMVTGVLFLVPSGIAAAGGLAMTYHTTSGDSYSNGLIIGFRMVQVAIGITVGLFFSSFVVYSFGRGKSTATFTF